VTPKSMLLAAVLVLLPACDPAPCVRLSDCPSNLTCSAGACVVPPMDGSTNEDAAMPSDTGSTDTGSTDVGPRDAAASDTGRDGATSDAGADAP
jgi:hypothetical protein